MTARHSADTTALAPGLRYSGRDPRGWHVFIVDAQLSEDGNGDSPRKIFRVVLAEKVLVLVQQEVAKRTIRRAKQSKQIQTIQRSATAIVTATATATAYTTTSIVHSHLVSNNEHSWEHDQ